jgi:hypothetical protein
MKNAEFFPDACQKISIPPFDDGKVLAVSGAEYFMEKMTIIINLFTLFTNKQNNPINSMFSIS